MMFFVGLILGIFLTSVGTFFVIKILLRKMFEMKDNIEERDEELEKYESHFEKINFHLNKVYTSLNNLSQHPLVSDEPHVVNLLSIVKSSKTAIQLLIDGLKVEE